MKTHVKSIQYKEIINTRIEARTQVKNQAHKAIETWRITEPAGAGYDLN